MTHLRFTALALLLACLPATAGPRDALPSEVTEGIESMEKTCDQPAKWLPGLVSRRDVNADGVDDFIVDFGKLACGDSTSFFCGSGGCSIQVYASLRNRSHALVLDELVQGIRFEKVGGRPAAILSVHGSACGKVGAAACRKTLMWTGSAFEERGR